DRVAELRHVLVRAVEGHTASGWRLHDEADFGERTRRAPARARRSYWSSVWAVNETLPAIRSASAAATLHGCGTASDRRLALFAAATARAMTGPRQSASGSSTPSSTISLP